ncbi:MAG: hypothetical protein HOE30_09580 [Deltaproteobacteria bacterium]|jgi:hypothetical protein|nr:hypothetical protein [Deltaproteobacteria bacterium]MBT4268855.1 hypothetical protein [Deltaproteobacteria bacterium]MBT4641829.1 hypothetical protein [Deltaproteobacteria bacterium]MBT6504570.1 hypothetical protein [Deltaproteobacteria bacterium]MBT6612184.1 hypothetical protein [Deltaproteobacteria bacterium]
MSVLNHDTLGSTHAEELPLNRLKVTLYAGIHHMQLRLVNRKITYMPSLLRLPGRIQLYRFSLVLLIQLLISITSVSAIELYSIVHKGCEAQTGLIIHVDENQVYQVNTEGKLVIIPREGIEHILVYNTIANPFFHLDLTSGVAEYIRKVKVSSDDEIVFSGWPIRFIDDLIVFFDLEGKTHLVHTGDIQKFSKLETESLQLKKIAVFEHMNFGFGSNLPVCSERVSVVGATIQPTRMVSSQIKIQKFLSVYHDGFTKLKRLQKRTVFYARPYLFDEKTKIALVVIRDDFQEEFSAGMPLYFEWPSGRTFGPQGFLVVGSKPVEHLSSVEPVFQLRFDGKYQFLTASFAGNPFAFSAGSDYMIKNRFFMQRYFAAKGSNDLLFLPQFNQIALTGLERGPYSASVGYYYPLFGIQANGIFRELLSESAATIYKLQYTGKDFKFNLVASGIAMGSEDANAENIKLIYADEMSQVISRTEQSKLLETQLERFNFNSSFMRLNFDIDLTPEARIGISEVVILGDYRETISATSYKLRFNHFVTSISLQQEFGDNVALKGYLNYFLRNYDSQLDQIKSRHEESKFSFSVAIEFIL